MSLILIKRLVLSLSASSGVIGLILIGYGILFVNSNNSAESVFGCMFVILGFITMIMATFGFIAAFREAPNSLLMYLGVLVLMIRFQMALIGIVSELKNEIREEIRKATAFQPILVPDPAYISNAEIYINWSGVIKIFCWLAIVAEGVGAVFVFLLYRSITRSRLPEN